MLNRISFLTLYREPETVSLRMVPVTSSKEAPRRHFFHPKGREEHGSNPPDLRAFTLDFKLVLDQFCVRFISAS
jgi:hypothetical protein